MSEATRYTTCPERVIGLRAVLLNPGWLVGVLLLVLGSVCRLSDDLSVNLALVGGVAAAAGWLYWQHFTPSARLTRAMVDHGLVFRRPDGAIQIPRRVGRVRRDGRNHRVRWALPSGITLKDVQDRIQALEHQCSVGLHAWVDDGHLHADILRHDIPGRVEFDEFYAGPRPSGRLVVGLGRAKRGALWCDLASLPHLLVGGETGGGKSVFLRQLLTHLLVTHGPEQLRLTVVDLKGGIELHPYAMLPHSMGPVADSIPTAADALDRVRRDIDERVAQLRAGRHTDIDAWHAAGLPAWPRHLVVVDEVAELTTRSVGKDGRAARDEATGRLCEVARLGRAVGVHLIVCTQRPDADAVPGQLKACLPGTVAFRVRNATNSRILIESDRAALLPPHPGRAVWSHGTDLEEVQAIHIDADDSRRRLDERWGTQDGPLGTWTPALGDAAAAAPDDNDSHRPVRGGARGFGGLASAPQPPEAVLGDVPVPYHLQDEV